MKVQPRINIFKNGSKLYAQDVDVRIWDNIVKRAMSARDVAKVTFITHELILESYEGKKIIFTRENVFEETL